MTVAIENAILLRDDLALLESSLQRLDEILSENVGSLNLGRIPCPLNVLFVSSHGVDGDVYSTVKGGRRDGCSIARCGESPSYGAGILGVTATCGIDSTALVDDKLQEAFASLELPGLRLLPRRRNGPCRSCPFDES